MMKLGEKDFFDLVFRSISNEIDNSIIEYEGYLDIDRDDLHFKPHYDFIAFNSHKELSSYKEHLALIKQEIILKLEDRLNNTRWFTSTLSVENLIDLLKELKLKPIIKMIDTEGKEFIYLFKDAYYEIIGKKSEMDPKGYEWPISLIIPEKKKGLVLKDSLEKYYIAIKNIIDDIIVEVKWIFYSFLNNPNSRFNREGEDSVKGIPEDLKRELKELIRISKVNDVLRKLDDFFEKEQDIDNLKLVMNYQRNLHKNMEDMRKGIITKEVHDLEVNRVVNNIMSLYF